MIQPDKLKNIILESIDHIRSVKVIPRDYSIEKEGNYVFTGPRRAGKTFFMYQLIQSHHPDLSGFMYINFEDERLMEFAKDDFQLLPESYDHLFSQTPVMYFDEIQNISGWEKFCRRLADKGHRVYITGSNARMLSSEIATTLGGRYLIREIQSLSFREYVNFNNVELQQNYAFSDQKNTLVKLQETYLQFGGLPETLKYTHKRDYLSNIYQKVLFGDIIARYSLKNDLALRLLVKKMAESVNNETSFNRMKNLILSVGVKAGTATLIEYAGYLEESFMIFGISNYTAKFSERETKKKFYFSDTGLLNLFLFDQPTKLLENAVFLEIKRRYHSGIWYYKRNLETDFYVPDENLLIQVCYSMHDPETYTREVKSLIQAAKELNLNEAVIVTYNETKITTHEGVNIRIVPFWSWSLESLKLKV